MLIHRYYERMLKNEVSNPPESVCFMVGGKDFAGAPLKFSEVVSWCIELGIFKIVFHIESSSAEFSLSDDSYIPAISKLAKLIVSRGAGRDIEKYGDEQKKASVYLSFGMGGRDEIVSAVRKMARDNVKSSDVTEKVLESYLDFKIEPDFVIKTGGSHLTDFMIWQSVYSELFFSDVNWADFRKVDLLRALRDYQMRKRRYGT